MLQRSNAIDASGNAVLSDIGVYLQQKVIASFYKPYNLAYVPWFKNEHVFYRQD